MRALLAALIALFSVCAAAATPSRGLPSVEVLAEEGEHLHVIAGWLRVHGRDGYMDADVADATGIPRETGEELLAARQRGFTSDEVLRIAQLHGQYILFMVQRPDDQVYFYLSTPLGGLQKALLSTPSKGTVVPLERREAELRFQHEVQYWKDRTAAP
jgi:hypothetical protein